MARVRVAYECGHKRAAHEESTVAVATAAVATVDASPTAPPPITSPVQPFTQVVRDPAKYQQAIALAKQIGTIEDSSKLHLLCRGQMERENREVFYVVCVDMQRQLMHFEELARGSKSKIGIEVEDIWQLVALTRPHGYAIVHCHPSGNARPSPQDRRLTKEIRASSKKLFPNTAFLDHIVVGQRQYYSFLDNNWR